MKPLVAVLALLVAFALSSCTDTQYPGIQSDKSPETTSSGLKYIDLVVGTGASPERGMPVTVHYTGFLMDSTKFDSSVDRAEPFTFLIGVGQVIKGWDEGVATMKTGGKRKLIVPAQLGYGDRGVPGLIPPGSVLVFDVELLGVGPQQQ